MITILNLSRRMGGTNDHVCSSLVDKLTNSNQRYSYIQARDLSIEFCSNCRICMKFTGDALGLCPIKDDMAGLIDTIIASDVVVLVSPINCYDLPSILKIILERMSVFCYWEGEMYSPKLRNIGKDMKGILVTTSAMPSFMVPLTTKARNTFNLFSKPLRITKKHFFHICFKGKKSTMAFSEKDEVVVKKIFKLLSDNGRAKEFHAPAKPFFPAVNGHKITSPAFKE